MIERPAESFPLIDAHREGILQAFSVAGDAVGARSRILAKGISWDDFRFMYFCIKPTLMQCRERSSCFPWNIFDNMGSDIQKM